MKRRHFSALHGKKITYHLTQIVIVQIVQVLLELYLRSSFHGCSFSKHTFCRLPNGIRIRFIWSLRSPGWGGVSGWGSCSSPSCVWFWGAVGNSVPEPFPWMLATNHRLHRTQRLIYSSFHQTSTLWSTGLSRGGNTLVEEFAQICEFRQYTDRVNGDVDSIFTAERNGDHRQNG